MANHTSRCVNSHQVCVAKRRCNLNSTCQRARGGVSLAWFLVDRQYDRQKPLIRGSEPDIGIQCARDCPDISLFVWGKPFGPTAQLCVLLSTCRMVPISRRGP